jgi:hypothetical protein
VFQFSLQILPETFFIPRRTERDVIKNVYWSLWKVLFILVRCVLSVKFLNRFSNNTQIKISWKSVHRELSCSMRMGRYDKDNSHFCNLANPPKTEKLHNGYEQTNVLLFQCSIEHSTWKHTHVYCCRKHKFAMKALMCNTYFTYTADR